MKPYRYTEEEYNTFTNLSPQGKARYARDEIQYATDAIQEGYRPNFYQHSNQWEYVHNDLSREFQNVEDKRPFEEAKEALTYYEDTCEHLGVPEDECNHYGYKFKNPDYSRHPMPRPSRYMH